MAGDNVVLVGFMGAGKSVCGRMLARRLGRCFVETDDMIVSRDGRSIPEIFRQDGEEAFRRLEGETLEALRLKSRDVIATGGGLPCRDGRMEALRALGTVVWLRGDLSVLLDRAARIGGRPMLQRSPADIERLYRSREPYYATAHVTVDTAGLGVDQVVARVITALRAGHAARV
ncbi:MAG TPA: shikimate kinase [Methylomirabilota bacterium]|jgi:shikimate kinase|nr:shikimate kinase [Methylomirabilota bacterium]